MTRVNLAGAVVKQLKIGTPLTQHSLWDQAQLSFSQVSGMQGIAYTHYVMARVLQEFLPDHNLTPFISGIIESERYGCWQEYLSRIALNFPEYFGPMTEVWRNPTNDAVMRCWMEIDLLRLWTNLNHQNLHEIWREFDNQKMPKVWSIYFRWCAKGGNEGLYGMSNLLSPEDADSLGGVNEQFMWTDPAANPSDLETVNLPLCIQASKNPTGDLKKLTRTVGVVRPLTPDQIVQMINAECGEGREKSSQGIRSIERPSMPKSRQMVSEAAG